MTNGHILTLALQTYDHLQFSCMTSLKGEVATRQSQSESIRIYNSGHLATPVGEFELLPSHFQDYMKMNLIDELPVSF